LKKGEKKISAVFIILDIRFGKKKSSRTEKGFILQLTILTFALDVNETN
jgi:hypothetical protein